MSNSRSLKLNDKTRQKTRRKLDSAGLAFSPNHNFQVCVDLPLRGGEKWLSEVDRLAKVGFALSDKSRLRIMLFVAGASPTQGEICARMGYAKSTISRHMAILVDAGVVRRMCDTAGRQVFTLNQPLLEELTPSLLAWLGRGKKEGN